MHKEWLEKVPLDQILDHPNFILEKYFADAAGNPDPTKTREIIGILYPRCTHIDFAEPLRKAARRVNGLHLATVTGCGPTQTIYLGWDRDALKKTAEDHAVREEDLACLEFD
jgi:hypothetical protein